VKLQVTCLFCKKALRLQGNHSIRLHALFIHMIVGSGNTIKITKVIGNITIPTCIVFITHE